MKKPNTKSLNELANNPRNKYALIAIDETEYWRDDIREKANCKIFGVYMVNLKEPTHLCSFDVSYPAEWVKNFFESSEGWNEDDESEMDELVELEMTSEDDGFQYLSGNSVFDVRKMYNSGDLEDAMEYERGNPTVC